MHKSIVLWLAMSAGALLSTVGCEHKPEYYKMPAVGEIESVSVTLFGHFLSEPNSKTFLLPSSDIKVLLDALSPDPVKAHNRLIFNGTSIVRLEFNRKKGAPLIIEIPISGQNKLEFRANNYSLQRNGDYVKRNLLTGEDTVFYPDEATNLYNFLRKIWLEQQRDQ
jgi:hypothetical protein